MNIYVYQKEQKLLTLQDDVKVVIAGIIHHWWVSHEVAGSQPG